MIPGKSILKSVSGSISYSVFWSIRESVKDTSPVPMVSTSTELMSVIHAVRIGVDESFIENLKAISLWDSIKARISAYRRRNESR